jgi:hypothetical protein
MRKTTVCAVLAIGFAPLVAKAVDIDYQLDITRLESGTVSMKAVDANKIQFVDRTWKVRRVENGDANSAEWEFGIRSLIGIVVHSAAAQEEGSFFGALWPLSRQVMYRGDDDHVFSIVIASMDTRIPQFSRPDLSRPVVR